MYNWSRAGCLCPFAHLRYERNHWENLPLRIEIIEIINCWDLGLWSIKIIEKQYSREKKFWGNELLEKRIFRGMKALQTKFLRNWTWARSVYKEPNRTNVNSLGPCVFIPLRTVRNDLCDKFCIYLKMRYGNGVLF